MCDAPPSDRVFSLQPAARCLRAATLIAHHRRPPAASRLHSPPMDYELGIIGAGNMAEAIARGVMARGVFAPAQMAAAGA